jgi:uncharacterized protein
MAFIATINFLELMMTTQTNKQLLQHAFAELSKGNGQAFVDLWADDFCWTLTGSTSWSKTYSGKEAVRAQLIQPLFSRFATQYTNTASRFIAEDDYVVVECKGNVMTKSGVPYNNTYCYVCRFSEGKMRELTEYFDTELVTKALGELVAAE